MSFGLLQASSSPSPTFKADGSGVHLWTTPTTQHNVPSTTPFRLHPESNAHRTPQFTGWTVSSIVTRTVQQSQPHAWSILPSPTPSQRVPGSSLPVPTPLVVSVTSVSTSLPSTSTNRDSSSSVPLESISTLVSDNSAQPTSLIIVASESVPTFSVVDVTASTTDATTTVTSSVETASPTSSNAAGDDSAMKEGGHHAPFYIAVIVGSVFAIGLIAAIIAWAVRLRMHAKRRRENPEIPWTNYHGSDDGLEEGRDAIFIGGSIDRIGSKDISSQDIIPWESRVNRSFGELRSDNSLPRSMQSNLAPPPAPYLDYQPYYHDTVDSNIAYPTALHHGYARRTPYPDTASLDDHGSAASSLGPLKVANRTPADASPASSFASSPVSMYTAPTGTTGEAESRSPFVGKYSENMLNERVRTENTWKTLPMPGETQKFTTEATSEDSSWTASLRSNLTHAFNAVAASLPSGPALMSNKYSTDSSTGSSSDSLPPHRKQSSGQRSLGSIFTDRDQPWILEENGNGAGRVYFPDLEDEGDAHSSGTSTRRVSARRSALRPPQSAMLRHDEYLSEPRRGRAPGKASLRRSESNASTNSMYSTASGVSDVAPRLPALSRQSSIRLDPMATVYENKEEDNGSTFQPRALFKRSSSSHCSITDYYHSDQAGEKVGGSDETLVR
ncbi:hypothetical protein H0H92_008810 [Tricholoma furcatifolium]|nr:hypothetical protein H0H92_008810 [Tricholoma furcatifolium]